MKKIILLLASFFLIGCQSKYPGVSSTYERLLDSSMVQAADNSIELFKALEETPKEQKDGMAFLISYMPERDLKTLSAELLLENVKYAYKAREKFPWCATLPDSVFLNEVLPYYNISEERELWRKEFFNRFSKYVENKDDLIEAILTIADTIKIETGVEFNTKRSRVDISPLQAIKEKMATCTGLSILLTDAYRAVGIPSRVAGTPMWTNYRGNHTWSEVLVDGKWKFIEYYPDSLNKSWFLADAGKADPDNPLHWIYAVSYKPTGEYYYASGMSNYLLGKIDVNLLPKRLQDYYKREGAELTKIEKPYVNGINVTQRYIDIYENSVNKIKLADDELIGEFVVYTDQSINSSSSRAKSRVEIYLDDKLVNFGYSPKETDDLNQFLKIKLKKNTDYTVIVKNSMLKDDYKTTISTKEDQSQNFSINFEIE